MHTSLLLYLCYNNITKKGCMQYMIIHKRGCVYNFNFHLVFVTKYRKEVFDSPEKVKEMKELLRERADMSEIDIQQMEVMPDHVHMLISFSPKERPVDIVKGLKGWTARKWFELHPETKQMLWGGHLWSPSYFMSTLGDMNNEVVKKYIASQYTAAMKSQQNGKYGELERERKSRN